MVADILRSHDQLNATRFIFVTSILQDIVPIRVNLIMAECVFIWWNW